MDCLPQIHVAAIHAEAGYHSSTPGVGILCRTEDDALLGAGRYANSEKTKKRSYSNYGFVGVQPYQIGGVKIGGIVGLVDGYSYRKGKPFPMAALVLSAGDFYFTLVPEVKNKTPAVMLFSYTVRF